MRWCAAGGVLERMSTMSQAKWGWQKIMCGMVNPGRVHDEYLCLIYARLKYDQNWYLFHLCYVLDHAFILLVLSRRGVPWRLASLWNSALKRKLWYENYYYRNLTLRSSNTSSKTSAVHSKPSMVSAPSTWMMHLTITVPRTRRIPCRVVAQCRDCSVDNGYVAVLLG